MKYITEKELKEWFKTMKKKYPHSALCEQLKTFEDLMFSEFWKEWGDNLKFKEMKEERRK